MRRFARPVFVFSVCTFLFCALARPAAAQYPKKDPNMTARTPTTEKTRLQSKAPGHYAVVVLNDGTLRSGWVNTVDDTHLRMQKQGEEVPLPLKDIVTVTVQRPNHALGYAVAGYLVTGTIAAIIAHNDDHEFKDLVVVFGVGGIPGGLLGALIGRSTSGDVEIIP
jgi:hypothetical protein